MRIKTEITKFYNQNYFKEKISFLGSSNCKKLLLKSQIKKKNTLLWIQQDTITI